jgi:hypothetical protein
LQFALAALQFAILSRRASSSRQDCKLRNANCKVQSVNPPTASSSFSWDLTMLRRCLIGLMGLAVLCGCNSASVSGTVPVGGKVTYKGAGVEGAIITFIPEGNGRTATATTTAGGQFSLTTVDSPGALPGKYKVTVDKVDYGPASNLSMEEAAKGNPAEGQAKRLLPAKYANAASTPLAIEVPSGGKKDLDLPLVD